VACSLGSGCSGTSVKAAHVCVSGSRLRQTEVAPCHVSWLSNAAHKAAQSSGPNAGGAPTALNLTLPASPTFCVFAPFHARTAPPSHTHARARGRKCTGNSVGLVHPGAESDGCEWQAGDCARRCHQLRQRLAQGEDSDCLCCVLNTSILDPALIHQSLRHAYATVCEAHRGDWLPPALGALRHLPCSHHHATCLLTCAWHFVVEAH
jgi:hypothetical protein